jgi:hypothetical protein
MKKMPYTRKIASWSAGLVLATSLVLSGCQKDQEGDGAFDPNIRTITDKETIREIDRSVQNMPKLAFYNEPSGKFIVIDPKSSRKTFNFASPPPGISFATSSGVQFQQTPDGGGMLFFTPGGTGGGTVVAGSSALNISYAFCFAANDEGAFDFFGPDLSGFSLIFGIAGDLDALFNADFEEEDDLDFTQYFQGFAAYYVFASPASGTYPILNWFNDLDQPESAIANKGFSYVVDFQLPGFYFSNNGSINVSNTGMTFNGQYLALLGMNLFDDDDYDYNPGSYATVSGFGQMNCN